MEHGDTILVFFGYGLASFAMGLVLVVELRRAAPSPLATSLRSLAAFGLLNGSAQWVVMAQLVESGGTVQGSALARALFLALSILGAFALMHFAVGLLGGAAERPRLARWLPVSLLGLLALTFLLPLPAGAPAAAAAGKALTCLDCHAQASTAYLVASGDRLNAVDVAMRYLLILPASVLAAAGFLRQRARFRELGLPTLASEATGASVALGAIALASGSIVPPAPYPPASFVNYATVGEWAGFAPQLVAVVATAALAVFVMRMLGVFDLERRRQLQAAVIEERERIGREMHDGVAQTLGYVGMRSSLAGDLLDRNALREARDVVTSIEAAADEAYRDVRASILELRSSDLAAHGLRRGIEEYGERFGYETGISVSLDVADAEHVHWSPLVELQLIRIVQEALANVRKHARARHVSVGLRADAAGCVLTVADDGSGFDPTRTVRPGAHFGLATMRERAESVGASIGIASRPGSGTTVSVTVPHTMKAG